MPSVLIVMVCVRLPPKLSASVSVYAVERSRNRRPCGLIAVAAFIAGRRDVGDAFRFHGLNRLRHHAVLEERLVEIADVVDDHLGAGGGERENAVGKVLLAVEGGIEGEAGAGGDVVDDLHHRAALVGAARTKSLSTWTWMAAPRSLRRRPRRRDR